MLVAVRKVPRSSRDLYSGWFGTGPDRGIALVFTVAGLVGVLVAVAALRSRSYHLLSARYLNGDAAPQA